MREAIGVQVPSGQITAEYRELICELGFANNPDALDETEGLISGDALRQSPIHPESGALLDKHFRYASVLPDETALQILHRAWPDVASDPRVSTKSNEDEITDVLRRRMSDVKRSMTPSPQMRFERESQSDAAEDESELGLIDIQVAYTWDEETYFVIECKRIWSTDNSLALKYVRNGVNRFASGKYSAGHAYGAMVGYVLCGNCEACIVRIRHVLETEPEDETGYDSDHGWQKSGIVPGVDAASTRHQQKAHENTIELIHTFVDL